MGKVLVIGAGAAGLASAYYLAKHGQQVTVVDKGEPGDGCSWGSIGNLAPSHSFPITAPGVVAKGLRWMLRKDSPLYIKPTALPQLTGWLLAFWKNCNEGQYMAGLTAMSEMTRNNMDLFDALRADGVSFEMHNDGMLIAFLTSEGIQEKLRELRPMQDYGYFPRQLGPEEVLAMEPAFKPTIAGGLFLEQERHVRPTSLTAGLAKKLREMGCEIRSGTEVTGFTRSDSRITAAQTSAGPIDADQVVIATGAWSPRLTRSLGIHLPVQAAKGYSITIENPKTQIRLPLYLGESKVCISPYDGTLRIGGTLELSGINTNIDPERIAGLRRAASLYLKDPVEGTQVKEWAGMRSLLPDGMLAIGRLPVYHNLFTVTGHGMNGILMAPVTGKAIADLICTGKSDVDLSAYDPTRFAAG